MKMPNYISRDMEIRAAADLVNAFQTTRPESHFQLGGLQLKAIRQSDNIFDAETKTPNRDALPTHPSSTNEEEL